ncbi:type I addiction module toxin, SymE family [Thalassomonas viridans]|uniref:Type I addiction module toxin, SymE family n=1 Tax=Thalassomonas viridans TaxID=137584 RepID=A0AAF0C971_9GAMM|nr:SymE family type I addiction module toxin [Thalassomonas viridans]WDE04574.1 type I addiction module toxin, SymE family [Thalassomonas viridans]
MAEYHHTPELPPAKAKYPATRQLTVLKTLSNSSVKGARPGINYLPVNLEPCIVLRGKWFKDAGFTIDEKVTVTVNQGELTIKLNQALLTQGGKQ